MKSHAGCFPPALSPQPSRVPSETSCEAFWGEFGGFWPAGSTALLLPARPQKPGTGGSGPPPRLRGSQQRVPPPARSLRGVTLGVSRAVGRGRSTPLVHHTLGVCVCATLQRGCARSLQQCRACACTHTHPKVVPCSCTHMCTPCSDAVLVTHTHTRLAATLCLWCALCSHAVPVRACKQLAARLCPCMHSPAPCWTCVCTDTSLCLCTHRHLAVLLCVCVHANTSQ